MAETVNKSRRRFLGTTLGGLVGAGAGYIAGDMVKGMFGATEETQRDFHRIYQFNRGDVAHLEAILKSVPEDKRLAYSYNNEQRDSLWAEFREYMSSLERLSLKTPLTSPEKKLVDANEGIMEKLKGLFGEKKKKEAEIGSNPTFQKNYNALGTLRVSLKEKIGKIESGLNDLAYKVRVNEHNTHGFDNEGRDLLNDLFDEHEKAFDLLTEFKALTPEQILEGVGNKQYVEILRLSTEHGIKPYEPNGLLYRNAIVGTTLIGAAVGGVLGRMADYTIRTGAGAVGEAGKIALKPIGWFAKGINRIRGKK